MQILMWKCSIVGAIVLAAPLIWAGELDDLKKSHIKCTLSVMEATKTKIGLPDPLATCVSDKAYNRGSVFNSTKVGGVAVQFSDKKTNEPVKATITPPKDYVGPVNVRSMFTFEDEGHRSWMFDELRKGGYDPVNLRIDGYYLHKNTMLYKEQLFDGCKKPKMTGCAERYSKEELKQYEFVRVGGTTRLNDRGTGLMPAECPHCGRRIQGEGKDKK